MNIFVDNTKYEVDLNRFPAGEIGVILSFDIEKKPREIIIQYDWPLYSNAGLFILAQVVETLRRSYFTKHTSIELHLPYVPYSRQDRVCNPGESFSLKVFADIINAMQFDIVHTWDNHSDVATALLNNCSNSAPHTLLKDTALGDMIQDNCFILVSPDAGAVKKTQAIAKTFNQRQIVRADKERDLQTGAIIATSVIDKALVQRNASFLVVDDICDGGGTFVGLGNEIRNINEQCNLCLYVTHGFFTKGLGTLLDIYDTIYTTESVCRTAAPQLKIINKE